MTIVLEQEDSIAFLQKVKVVPQKAYAKILEKDGTKYVLRQYKIEELDGGYDMINISYALNIEKDLTTFYSVYATSDKTDSTICLCVSQKNVYNTLFDSILSLEENVWKNSIAGNCDITFDPSNYRSLIFETDDFSYPKLADAIYDTHMSSALKNEFEKYVNTNKIVPKNNWKKFLLGLTKLLNYDIV